MNIKTTYQAVAPNTLHAQRPNFAAVTDTQEDWTLDQVKSAVAGLDGDDPLNYLTLGCLGSETDQVKSAVAGLDGDDPLNYLTLGCLGSETDQVKSAAGLDTDGPFNVLTLGCLSSSTDAPKASVDGFILSA